MESVMDRENEAKEVEELADIIWDKMSMEEDINVSVDWAKYLISKGYRKSPSAGLLTLDEEGLFEIISAHNTSNPDRFYNPKVMAEDRQLAIDICSKFAIPLVTEDDIQCVLAEFTGIDNIRDKISKAIIERLKG
jgi:hypothetical protein